jgi:Ca2+-binding RTX toxin-like protein
MTRERKRPTRPRTDRWWWVKIIVTMASAAIALVGTTGVQPAGASGGDPVGSYVMTDSSEPGGPEYAPLEVGSNLFQTDNSEATVTLPFPFNFYGTNYTTATIGANGAIAFPAGQDIDDGPVDLDDHDQLMVAPWWSDWNPGSSGDASGTVLRGTIGVAPHRIFVVWWHGVRNRDAVNGPGTAGTADFQAQLFEGSNRIEFHYLANHVAWSEHEHTTVGIDHGAITETQWSPGQDPQAGTAIRFDRASCAGYVATVVGTSGDDHLVGTAGPDVFAAAAGNDTITARGGDDIVCAGTGNDQVDGGGGRDRAIGGRGRDLLSGNVGADRLVGGLGRDTCRGGPGNDTAPGCEIRTGTP